MMAMPGAVSFRKKAAWFPHMKKGTLAAAHIHMARNSGASASSKRPRDRRRGQDAGLPSKKRSRRDGGPQQVGEAPHRRFSQRQRARRSGNVTHSAAASTASPIVPEGLDGGSPSRRPARRSRTQRAQTRNAFVFSAIKEQFELTRHTCSLASAEHQPESPLPSPEESPMRSEAVPPTESSSPQRRRKRKPYGRRTWLEQKAALDEESRKAELSQRKEAKRLQRLPKNGLDLLQFRPSAPRNTTQFLIDSRQSDATTTVGEGEEHGSMFGFRNELAALKAEVIGLSTPRRRTSPASPRTPPLPVRTSSRANSHRGASPAPV